ncbi:MAG: hypothetical protein JNM99_15935 [Verrucomicrobiaceae bacterium]|nr:hypothetical protein [Verrucomicrobiaceae bacterium]
MTERPFVDGEKHYTAIYFDPKAGEYTRRDVSLDAWEQEIADRKPFSFWKSVYEKSTPDGKPEIAPREDALSMLQRLIEEGNPYTENARYILAAMLERKRVLAPKDRKETEEGIMLIYENKKTGEIYIVRDPELRLDEVAGVQEEVAMLLGFGGPAAEAAKVAKVEIGPDGKVIRRKGDAKKKDEPATAEAAATTAATTTQETTTSESPAPEAPTPDADASSPVANETDEAHESHSSHQSHETPESEEVIEEDEDEDFDDEDEFEEEAADEELEDEEDSEESDDVDEDAAEDTDEEDEDLDEEDDDDFDDEDESDETDLDEAADSSEEDEDDDSEDEEDEGLDDDSDDDEEVEEDEGESVMIEEEEDDDDSK